MFPGGLRQVLSQELPCLTCGVQSSFSIECTVTVIPTAQMFGSLHPNGLMQVPRGDALAQFIAVM